MADEDQHSETPHGEHGNGDSDSVSSPQGHGPKRRRIAKACDMCRLKKMKCDGNSPRCSYCETHRAECLFTRSDKKRQAPRSAKYVEQLETRLAQIEARLHAAGLLEPRPETNSSQTTSSLEHHTSAVHDHATGGVENLADQMCSLVTNNLGETKYIGSSSSMTILSPVGMQWVKEKTGDDSFQHMIAGMAHKNFTWFHWKPEIFGDIFTRRTYKALPPKHEALVLLKLYFEHCNTLFPLFHEPTFMHLVDKHYSPEPFEGSGWWACFNVALAIAHRMRAHSHSDNQEDGRKAWLYIKNAFAVLTEMTMRNNDLLSVQALTGMALFLQGTPNPFTAFYLIGAALRLAQGIGLHKGGGNFNLNPVETEQRKRVFWVLYIMDKDISLRAGRPAAQDDDDMNVGLPSEEPEDQVGTILLGESPSRRVNMFRKLCEFGQIQSSVYKRLYSVKASQQTDGELLQTIGELDKSLEDWKESMPPEVRPEHEIKIAQPFQFSIGVLHFAYYNCLTTIHRMSVHHGSWVSRPLRGDHDDRALNPRVFMSAALCVNAARTSISLIDTLPPLHNGCTWIIMYYPISALVTLFANTLQNPRDPRGPSDLALMHGVVDWLSTLSDEDTDEYVKRMRTICSEFERISRKALEKARETENGQDAVVSAVPDTTFVDPVSEPPIQAPNGPWLDLSTPGLDMNTMPYMDYGQMDVNAMLQQPFVPQDLWQMPMTLEWDWAEVGNWAQGLDFSLDAVPGP